MMKDPSFRSTYKSKKGKDESHCSFNGIENGKRNITIAIAKIGFEAFFKKNVFVKTTKILTKTGLKGQPI